MGAVRGDCKEVYIDQSVTSGLSPLVAAAHELKAPLALVRQLSLIMMNDDLDQNERSQINDQITLTAERALRLTSDLTRSVRLSDAMFELEPINPQPLCEDIVHELTPLFKAHNRKICLKKRKNSLLTVANRDLLRRIILNFGDNALHYTEADSEVEIQINSMDYGKIIRLGVRDYGPAVSANSLKELREKISTAPASIHARPNSSGLGLYISSKFADAMNGRIGVVRHRDGATFYVDLQASRQMSLL